MTDADILAAAAEYAAAVRARVEAWDASNAARDVYREKEEAAMNASRKADDLKVKLIVACGGPTPA